ncbi:hypothetical protein [Solibacillus sp. R5-41]|nr:hypothetical protein [Solibacillus sp. R5-41]
MDNFNIFNLISPIIILNLTAALAQEATALIEQSPLLLEEELDKD